MSNFSERHNGLNESDINKMLKDIGVDSIDKLIDQTIPSSIKLNKALDLPNALSESRFLEQCSESAFLFLREMPYIRLVSIQTHLKPSY